MKKIKSFSIIWLNVMLCAFLLLVSCDTKSRKNYENSRITSYDEQQVWEEDTEIYEDTSREEDDQYMGLNGLNGLNVAGQDVTTSVYRESVIVQNTTVYTDRLTKNRVILPVNWLSQKPELPSGCEITSLTTVLNFYGYNVDKTIMADNYLPKSNTDKDFWKVFIGNPRYNTGFGCYAQPIVDAANKYLAEIGSAHKAYNYSGVEFEQLLIEIENGIPVIIWGTLNMSAPYYTYTWTLADGTQRRWIAPEHCLVLIGYDIDRGVAIISDPMRGIVEYDLNTVKSRYLSLYSQCVIIR